MNDWSKVHYSIPFSEGGYAYDDYLGGLKKVLSIGNAMAKIHTYSKRKTEQ